MDTIQKIVNDILNEPRGCGGLQIDKGGVGNQEIVVDNSHKPHRGGVDSAIGSPKKTTERP